MLETFTAEGTNVLGNCAEEYDELNVLYALLFPLVRCAYVMTGVPIRHTCGSIRGGGGGGGCGGEVNFTGILSAVFITFYGCSGFHPSALKYC